MLQSIDEKPYTEILDGEAVQKVSPQRRHGIVQLRLASTLMICAGNRGDVATEWRFYMDPPGGLRTSLVPDVAFVSRERLERLTPQMREKPPFAPDIAIEIRSPGDKVSHIEWKMRAYLKMGGSLALDVMLDEKAIRSFTVDGMRTFGINDRFVSEPFPWFAFDVALIDV